MQQQSYRFGVVVFAETNGRDGSVQYVFTQGKSQKRYRSLAELGRLISLVKEIETADPKQAVELTIHIDVKKKAVVHSLLNSTLSHFQRPLTDEEVSELLKAYHQAYAEKRNQGG
mgnify:CR=1 FL=1